ncbi:MAG TPA: D-alanyl-D-alanine carboxypeptidase [Candidatus Dormibacteraeota bacterium]|jgi:D-alanyl-D-alanine carboxypeptidase (penicillin-binding protein 5/6)|nr:D-alanyl-D-alanine carboxypeptidase [Candidatus Dormibacteraeota bacterium]
MRHPGRAIAAGLLGAILAAGTAVSLVRINATPPPPSLQLTAARSYTPIPGPPVPVHQPPQGSLALQGDGRDIALLDADTAHPIASVAKVMTALETLRAHPLKDEFDEGAVLTMTDVDVADYKETVRNDGSSLPVVTGEKLTERQLLLGLLLPSANNFADTLGRWVSGSVDAFVARLNAAAQQMGMAHTHFADPHGFSSDTVSSASDLVLLGKAVLANAPLSALVATRQAKLPDGTQLDNLDSLLGTVPGWLGIKTGSTPLAGGCLLFAARRDVGGATVTMIGAVLHQTDLAAALDAARTAVESGFQGYSVVAADASPPAVTGHVSTRWGATSTLHVATGARGAVALRMGSVVQLTTVTRPVPPGAAAGATVGTVAGSVDGVERFRWSVVLDSAVSPPDWTWMLLHNNS